MSEGLAALHVFVDLAFFAFWGIYFVFTVSYIGMRVRTYRAYRVAHDPRARTYGGLDSATYFSFHENSSPAGTLNAEEVEERKQVELVNGEVTGGYVIDHETLRKHRAMLIEHDRAADSQAHNDHLIDVLGALGLYLVCFMIFAVCLRSSGWRWAGVVFLSLICSRRPIG